MSVDGCANRDLVSEYIKCDKSASVETQALDKPPQLFKNYKGLMNKSDPDHAHVNMSRLTYNQASCRNEVWEAIGGLPDMIIALDLLSDRAARGRPRVHGAVYGHIPSFLFPWGKQFPC